MTKEEDRRRRLLEELVDDAYWNYYPIKLTSLWFWL